MFKAMMLTSFLLVSSNFSFAAVCNVKTSVSSVGTIKHEYAEASADQCADAARWVAYQDCIAAGKCVVSYNWGYNNFWSGAYHQVQCRDPYSCMYY